MKKENMFYMGILAIIFLATAFSFVTENGYINDVLCWQQTPLNDVPLTNEHLFNYNSTILNEIRYFNLSIKFYNLTIKQEKDFFDVFDKIDKIYLLHTPEINVYPESICQKGDDDSSIGGWNDYLTDNIYISYSTSKITMLERLCHEIAHTYVDFPSDKKWEHYLIYNQGWRYACLAQEHIYKMIVNLTWDEIDNNMLPPPNNKIMEEQIKNGIQ